MARRRYNPSQKRGYHGRWTAGAASNRAGNLGGSAPRRAAGLAAGSKNTARYTAYQAKLQSASAQAPAPKPSRFKANAKKVAVVGAVSAAALGGAYLVHKNGQKQPVIGRNSPATKLVVKRQYVKPGARNIAHNPVPQKAATPKQHVSLLSGVTPSASKSRAKSNPTTNPVKTPVTHGVSSVASAAPPVNLIRKKPKSKPNGIPGFSGDPSVTEDGKRVRLTSSKTDSERLSTRKAAISANQRLHEMEKKAGVNVGAEARAKEAKKAAIPKRATKSEAALERNRKLLDAKVSANREAFKANVTSAAQAMAGKQLSHSARVEERYLSLLQKHVDSGKRLPIPQRRILEGDVAPQHRRLQKERVYKQNNISGAKFIVGEQQKARVARAKAKRAS